MFTAALFIIAKIWKQHKYLSRVNEENVLYPHTHRHTVEYHSAIKKKWNLSTGTTQMDLEGITLTEIAQREKNKHCTISLLCGIYKKKKYREQIGGCRKW